MSKFHEHVAFADNDGVCRTVPSQVKPGNEKKILFFPRTFFFLAHLIYHLNGRFRFSHKKIKVFGNKTSGKTYLLYVEQRRGERRYFQP